MNLIHKKKDGRLHIYVRQDKYKGVLKSHNWVGRTYINGLQKVVSSGTSNLDEAIPILEKWFDMLLQEKIPDNSANNPTHEQNIKEMSENINTAVSQTENQNSASSNTIPVEDHRKKDNSINVTGKGTAFKMFDKIKNFKFSSLKGTSRVEDQNLSGNSDAVSTQNKIKKFYDKYFKARVSKLSVVGEEISGLDITREAIRVAQVSQDKDENWIFDKFSYRLLDQTKIAENILDSKDYLAEEISLALANAKITSKNIALSIPVTSAIIKVVTSPLMLEDELQKAIETDSLWENLVQLTDNLNDYSVFHQVINRNSKTNTMEILFVASKLSDVNAYSSIVKKAGLNPVIMDVRCFALKNAHDNTKFKNNEEKINSAILELGIDENYILIIHNNMPIITDIFLRPQDKQHLLEIKPNQISAESEAVVRRHAMQIKQAITDYENKYETKINTIQVVSTLKNIDSVLNIFTKNLLTTRFVTFDPLQNVGIPSYNAEKILEGNKSFLSPVLGLAYRKLDVFGYYKFVTAVKNINLLPNRDAIRQQNKLKFLSGFALKGLGVGIAALYLILISFSFFQISYYKKKLENFDQVQTEFNKINLQHSKLQRLSNDMKNASRLGKLINSNQVSSYTALVQISKSVPQRVQFNTLDFNGTNQIIIAGSAFADQDISNFVTNLNGQSSVDLASLQNMNVSNNTNDLKSAGNKKGFTILVKLKAS